MREERGKEGGGGRVPGRLDRGGSETALQHTEEGVGPAVLSLGRGLRGGTRGNL